MSQRVAFITGASRGIGRASALALAEKGFDVVVTARTVKEGEKRNYGPTLAESRQIALPGSIERTADDVRARGRRALPIRLDLMDFDSIDHAIETTLSEWGRIDVLLNNGIYQGPGLMEPFLEIRQDAMHKIFQGNVFAQLHLTQKVVSHMRDHGGGTIINMTSGSALLEPPAATGQGGWGFAYAASKAAFTRMAGILNVEFGHAGVRAFNLNPGYVQTEAQKALRPEDDGKQFLQHYKGAPPEVPAAMIAWLASEEEAVDFLGEPVDALRWCAKKQLVPGWPPPKPSGGRS